MDTIIKPSSNHGAYMPVPQEDFTEQELKMMGAENSDIYSPGASSNTFSNSKLTYPVDLDDKRPKIQSADFYDAETGGESRHLSALDFSEKTIRMGFIRKIYSILMVQLLMTSGIIALFCLSIPVKEFVQTNHWLLFVAFGVTFAVMIALACSEDLRRKAPSNFILLAIFTVAEGFIVGTFATFFDAHSVLIAAGITTAVCLALTSFSFQSKYDFTAAGGMLFVCCICLLMFGFLAMFFPLGQLIYSTLGALLFSAFLVYDTQLMIGGNHQYAVSPEEYIFAALNIYMDIIMIFMYILRLFGNHQ